MNEKKKGIIVIASLFIVIATIVIASLMSGQSSEKKYENFQSAFNSDKIELIYFGRPTCSYCNLLEPTLKEMKERYNFDYTYINTDEMDSKYMNTIMKDLKLEEMGTPYLAIVKNGKIVDSQNGYTDYDKLFEFLQKNEIIAEDAKLLLNYIDYDQYEKLLNSEEKSIIVVGQSTCSFCVQAKLVLNQVAEEKNIAINYLNVSYLTEETGKKLEASLDVFKGEWGTPLTIITQSGKALETLDQLNTKDSYIKFFEKNGILK